MLRRVSEFFIIILFGGLALAYGEANVVKTDNFDEELSKFNIHFVPPAGWQKIKRANVPDAIYYSRPDKKANLCISFPRAANQPAFEVSLAMLRATKNPVSEEKIVFQDVPCYVFMLQETSRSGINIRIKDYQFLKNSMVYTITYVSTVEEFDKYLPEFNQALDSFNIVH